MALSGTDGPFCRTPLHPPGKDLYERRPQFTRVLVLTSGALGAWCAADSAREVIRAGVRSGWRAITRCSEGEPPCRRPSQRAGCADLSAKSRRRATTPRVPRPPVGWHSIVRPFRDRGNERGDPTARRSARNGGHGTFRPALATSGKRLSRWHRQCWTIAMLAPRDGHPSCGGASGMSSTKIS